MDSRHLVIGGDCANLQELNGLVRSYFNSLVYKSHLPIQNTQIDGLKPSANKSAMISAAISFMSSSTFGKLHGPFINKEILLRRSGSVNRAEAVLKLRSLKASGDFPKYWEFHEQEEFKKNHESKYKNKNLVKKAALTKVM